MAAQGSVSLLSSITGEYKARALEAREWISRDAYDRADAAFYSSRPGAAFMENLVRNYVIAVNSRFTAIILPYAIPKDPAAKAAFFVKLKTDLSALFSSLQGLVVTDAQINGAIDTIFRNPDLAALFAQIRNSDRILALIALQVLTQHYATDMDAFREKLNSIMKASCFGDKEFKDILFEVWKGFAQSYEDIVRAHQNTAKSASETISDNTVIRRAIHEVLAIVEEYLAHTLYEEAQRLYEAAYKDTIAPLAAQREKLKAAYNEANRFLAHEQNRNAASEANYDRHTAEEYNDFSVNEGEREAEYQSQINSNIAKHSDELKRIDAELSALNATIEKAKADARQAADDRVGLDPELRRLRDLYIISRSSKVTGLHELFNLSNEMLSSVMSMVPEKEVGTFEARLRSACESVFAGVPAMPAPSAPYATAGGGSGASSDAAAAMKEKRAVSAAIPSAPPIPFKEGVAVVPTAPFAPAVAADAGASPDSDSEIAAKMRSSAAIAYPAAVPPARAHISGMHYHTASAPAATEVAHGGLTRGTAATHAAATQQTPVAPAADTDPMDDPTPVTSNAMGVSTFRVVADAAPALVNPTPRAATPVYDLSTMPEVPTHAAGSAPQAQAVASVAPSDDPTGHAVAEPA